MVWQSCGKLRSLSLHDFLEFRLVDQWASLALIRLQMALTLIKAIVQRRLSLCGFQFPQILLRIYDVQRITIMLRPFQCLLACSNENGGIILGASGPCIYSFDLLGGSLLFIWPPELRNSQSPAENGSIPATQSLHYSSTGETEVQSSEPSPTPQKNNPKQVATTVLTDGNGNINNVVVTLAGPTKDRYIVAITKDKCIHVLHLLVDGTLTQVSER